MYTYYYEIEVFKCGEEDYNEKYNRKKMAEMLSALHKIFSIENNNYAISFPRYNQQKYTIGDVVRVFFHNEEDLYKLQNKLQQLLDSSEDFTYSRVYKVPMKRVTHVAQYKKMAVKNPAQQQKQYLRGCIQLSTVKNSLGKSEYPYVFLHSNSSKNVYPLIIRKEVFDKDSVNVINDKFSKYGFGGNSHNDSYVPEW